MGMNEGEARQMEALEESEIFEVLTFHKDSDSYRIEKGDQSNNLHG